MEHPVKIMIIDEFIPYRQILRQCLQQQGFIVTKACDHNLAKIQAEIARICPDIAIISYKRTRPDTLLTFEWVRKHYPEIKLIMITLYPSSEAIRESLRLQTSGLLVKSMDQATEIRITIQSIRS